MVGANLHTFQNQPLILPVYSSDLFPWSAAGYALAPHGNAPVERSNSFQRLVLVSATLHVNKTLESEIALHINCT